MTLLPLTPGPAGAAVLRSGIEWFCQDGVHAEADAVIGVSGIRLDGPANRFAGEHLQVAFALRHEGIIRHDWAQLGGFHDLINVARWDADQVVARLEVEVGDDGQIAAADGVLRQLYLAGRRMSALAGGHAGLLPGWHSRTRAWWDAGSEPLPTLLSLGICDADGAIRGDRFAFIEMFQAAERPAHIVFVPDHPIVPYARFLLEQFERTPSQYAAIAEDIMQALASSATPATPDDLVFAGALLRCLESSPMRDTYDVLTAQDVRQTGPADCVLLSLNSEQPSLQRHRRLGYHVNVFKHCRIAAGPAMQAWLGSAFEAVPCLPEDVRNDLRRLVTTVSAKMGTRFLILNRMSTSGLEDISSYSAFDGPLGSILANVSSKELNLMLHDLAEAVDLTIIDVDAIAAELGGGSHLPDGVHPSGLLQRRIRSEILQSFW